MFWVDRITTKDVKGKFTITLPSNKTKEKIEELKENNFEIISVDYNVCFIDNSYKV